jgi:hypothetical protein
VYQVYVCTVHADYVQGRQYSAEQSRTHVGEESMRK